MYFIKFKPKLYIYEQIEYNKSYGAYVYTSLNSTRYRHFYNSPEFLLSRGFYKVDSKLKLLEILYSPD